MPRHQSLSMIGGYNSSSGTTECAAFSHKSPAHTCRWLKGWFRSAKALQGLGKLDLAVQAASKAQELEPGNKDVSVSALPLLSCMLT